jgi:hypothetical protein
MTTWKRSSLAATSTRRWADMTPATSVRHIPTMTGADGRAELEHFYRDAVLPHLPGDLGFTRRSRIVDRFQLVDELIVSFLHDCEVSLADPGDRAHRAPRLCGCQADPNTSAGASRQSAIGTLAVVDVGPPAVLAITWQAMSRPASRACTV